MRFAEALEQGQTEFGTPDKVITTFVSKLFIFGEKVLKVYKHENFFFADLESFESRKEFCTEDFFWNNTAAPEIYLHLWGVQEKEGKFSLVPPGIGEDFVIEMSKIDDSQTLTKLLATNQLKKEHVGLFVDALVDTLATLTKERREQLHELFEKGLLEIMKEDVASLHTWMYGAQPHIPKEQTDAIEKILSRAVEAEPYFNKAPLSAAIDDNSDNLLLLNGKASFIDIMPPMKIWRVVDEYATISRFIVDVETLGGAELGGAARAAYTKYQRSIPPIAKLVHEIRAASIQWSYRHALKQHDIAEKFGATAKAKIEELQTLLG